MKHIYPSLMVVENENITREIEKLDSYCAGFHLDVMDGKFVLPTMWNDARILQKIIARIDRVWLHLMVEKPDEFYRQISLPSGSLVSFHIESEVDVFDFSKQIIEKTHKVSLAIRPKTPVSEIVPFLHVLDQVLVMSVDPGYSGQHFLKSSFDKIEELIDLRTQLNANYTIGVDGGINAENITELARAGVTEYAVATGIFGKVDHLAALQELHVLSDI